MNKLECSFVIFTHFAVSVEQDFEVPTVPSSGNYTFFSSAFRARFENVRARNATRNVARRSIENSRSININSRSKSLRVIALLESR